MCPAIAYDTQNMISYFQTLQAESIFFLFLQHKIYIFFIILGYI